MSNGHWKSKRSPDTAAAAPGSGVSRDYDVCKLVDTTTCIGCKACEVACVEWNGYEFRETTFDNTYQTMPETAWNFWNLIRFNEVETRWRHAMADAQRPVHALRRARLPDRLPCRWRNRAVHQRHRRFQPGKLHRLPVLRHRLPVQYSQIQRGHQESLQVHAVL